MMIIRWSKHVGVILSVLVCDILINVLLQTGALVGPLYVVKWNARWNGEKNEIRVPMKEKCQIIGSWLTVLVQTFYSRLKKIYK
jgi:hypothetical protein